MPRPLRHNGARVAVHRRSLLPFSAIPWQAVLSAVLLATAGCSTVRPDQPRVSVEGVIVRDVRLEREPIFGEAERERLSWLPLGLINRLHVTTRERVIRGELLFAEGRPLDPEHLQETERELRRLGIFTDVEVVAESAPGDSVDVVVRTQELWTTSIDAGYESFEGEALWSVSVRESNLFGTARRVEFDRSSGPDRSSWGVGLGDPQLVDGHWQGSFSYRDADDGTSYGVALARPYVSLTDRWSLATAFSKQTLAPRYYLNDREYVRPDATFRRIDLDLGRRLGTTTRTVWRVNSGFRSESQDLTAEGRLDVLSPTTVVEDAYEFPEAPPENRTRRTLYVGIGQRTRVYDELRFVRGMGKVEDIPIGPELQFSVGWTTRALGSSETGLWTESWVSWFERIGRDWLHAFSLSVNGLADEREGRDLRLQASVRGWHRITESLTFATNLNLGAISQADRHQVLALGLESGLRAARFREFNGDRMVRANFELRAVYTPGLWALLVPGVTLFADTGAAWFENLTDFRPELLRGAYGIGLRLGFNAAADDRPVRLDLAWPALYDTDRSSPVVSVGTGQVF